METIPKDLRLHIAKQFDMDARIKTALIGKLEVPQFVKDKIVKSIKKSLEYEPSYTNCCISLQISVGKYYTCFYDPSARKTYWNFTDTTIIHRYHNHLPLRPVKFPLTQRIYEMPA